MRIAAPNDSKRIDSVFARALLQSVRAGRIVRALLSVVSLVSSLALSTWAAQPSDWALKPIEADFDRGAAHSDSLNFALSESPAVGDTTFSLWQGDEQNKRQTIDDSIAPARFAQPATEGPLPRPSYLDIEEEMPRPSYLDSNEPDLSISEQIERLNRRIEELETGRIAQEDATRTIIRQSFAERGSNITDTVVFGGTMEVLTFWAEDFDGIAESDIVLDTAQLDFEIQVNSWSRASMILEYDDGGNFLFPTNEEDEIFVDRFNIDTAFITIGDTTRYPLFTTFGRVVVPFGISTGDPVADVLTIIDPLTVEIFETKEDVVLFGFEWPTPPPPPPVSPYAAPAPLPPRPLLINPLVRRTTRRMCEYCGLPEVPPAAPAITPAACVSPFTGAVYFFNGDTTEGVFDENHIEQMGGTLGYRAQRRSSSGGILWSVDLDVDVISSVFDSRFLEFEYRHFLPDIGFVPGMAAHMKSSFGPVLLVLEWNGAVSQAEFIDDAANPVVIQPEAWQIQLGYQFDWNPGVEVIGAQGTYFVIGYSESSDMGGVTRILAADPLNPFRVGNVPERRLSVGIGEWVLDGMRVALEYSHAVDYDGGDFGTGNNANGVFMQLTYEW